MLEGNHTPRAKPTLASFPGFRGEKPGNEAKPTSEQANVTGSNVAVGEQDCSSEAELED